MIQETKHITGWGRTSGLDALCLSPESEIEIGTSLAEGPVIPRGFGRSYGDSSLSSRAIMSDRLSKFLQFDADTGVLTCEAGVELGDIVDTMLPRGWFPTVVPGTRHVSVGGAIASDVHGKNHHCIGSFCDHVTFIDLMLPTGEMVRCSPSQQPELFAATCGGMGLTGFITRAGVKMQPVTSGWVDQLTLKGRNLEHTLELLEKHKDWTYSVAWVDCLKTGAALGRSELILGRHAQSGGFPEPKQSRLGVPFSLPSWSLSHPLMRAFNEVHWRRAQDNHHTRVSPDTFFFPLDAIHNWNRIYGTQGFQQYQMVLPFETALDALRAILAISQDMGGAYLAVLKQFGNGNGNLLSFPRPGITLAMDFKNTAKVQRGLAMLDDVVLAHGGRLYLTKDARMPRSVFDAGYPKAAAFRELRARLGLSDILQSSQSKRLEL